LCTCDSYLPSIRELGARGKTRGGLFVP
jgi:hypothetical protein